MNSADALDFPDLSNDLQADSLSLFELPRWRHASHPPEELIGDDDSRDMCAHPLGRTGRAQWTNTDQDKGTLLQTQISHVLHETPKLGDVEAELRLNEVRPGFYLLLKTNRTEVKWGSKWILRSAKKEQRRSIQRTAVEKAAIIAHNTGRLQKGDGIQIEYCFGLGLVAILDPIAGEAKHIADAERCATKQVALQGNAVAITTGELKHRLNALTDQQRTDAQR